MLNQEKTRFNSLNLMCRSQFQPTISVVINDAERTCKKIEKLFLFLKKKKKKKGTVEHIYRKRNSRKGGNDTTTKRYNMRYEDNSIHTKKKNKNNTHGRDT